MDKKIPELDKKEKFCNDLIRLLHENDIDKYSPIPVYLLAAVMLDSMTDYIACTIEFMNWVNKDQPECKCDYCKNKKKN